MKPPKQCPECGERVNGWHGLSVHQRDTGDAPLQEGRCRVLHARRNLTLVTNLRPSPRPFDWARDDLELASDTPPLREFVDSEGFVYVTVG